MSAVTNIDSTQCHPASVEVFPGINTAPGVCGGKPRIRTTRIAVHVLVELRQLGCDDAKLLRNYPSLTQIDLENAWEYYRHHKTEVDSQIEEDNRDGD